jgi:hypothetical protein
MEKYAEIIKLLERVFGKGVLAKSLGTRTNVVRFPKGPQPIDPTTRHFDVAGTAQKNPELVNTIKNSIEDRIPDLTKMNDQELLTYKQNLQRLADHVDPPSADIIAAGNKQQVTGEGLEKLIDEQGLIASPKTPLGSAQFNIKRSEQQLKDFINKFDLDSLLQGAGKEQLSWTKMHNEGLVRATARQILSEDIKAGKIKGLTLDDLGTSREPIDYFRKIYGEGALEQLDSLVSEFNTLNTEQEASKLARSKFKFEPNENRAKGSQTYEELEKTMKGETKSAEVTNLKAEATKRTSVDNLIDEYNANQDRLSLTDEEGGSAISYDEFNQLKDRNREIAKALEDKGISSKIEEETKPEGIVIPFRKKNLEPENKADGGSIGLDYLMGIPSVEDNILPKEVTKKMNSTPRIIKNYLSNIDDYLNNYLKRFQPRPATIEDILQDSSKEPFSMAKGGRVGYASGGEVDKLLKFIASLNKELKGKKSMEVMNPKTGEITASKQPIKTLDFNPKNEFEKINTKHDERIVSAANEIGPSLDDPKMAAQQIAEVYAEMHLGKDYYDLPQRQQLDIYSKAYNYLGDLGNLRRQNNAIKKLNSGEQLDSFDERVLNKLNDTKQKEVLENFNAKDREPNKDGGLNHLLGF